MMPDLLFKCELTAKTNLEIKPTNFLNEDYKMIIRPIIYTFLLMLILQFITDWWSIAPAALLITFLKSEKASSAFLTGFIAAFLLWGGWSFFRDVANGGILSDRIGALLGAEALGSFLFLITGLLGGLVGGIAGLAGYYLQQQTGNGLPPSAHYEHS